jgi:hypothetical protein
MPITLWEHFTGIDWLRYALLSGNITAGLSIFCGLGGLLVNQTERSILFGLYAIVIGGFILLLDSNVLDPIRPLFLSKGFIHENLYFNQPALKGLFYLVLSILTFMSLTAVVSVGDNLFYLLTFFNPFLVMLYLM